MSPTEPPAPPAEESARRVSPWTWLGLILVALIARLIYHHFVPLIQRDGVTFLALARQALEGDPAALLRHDQHPLYPALVALVRPLAPDWEAAGLAVAVAAGALTVVPVVLIGIRVAGTRAALVGGLLFAVTRYPVQYAGSALSDSLHGLLFASAGWAGAAALGIGGSTGLGRPWTFLLAGAFAGLAYLARPEGLVIVPALVLASLVRLAALRGRQFADWLRGLALLGLALAATAGPYALHLTLDAGALTLSRKKQLFDLVRAQAEAPRPPPAPPEAKPPEAPAPPPEENPVPTRLAALLRSAGLFLEGLGWIPAGLLIIGLGYRRLLRAPLLAELYLLLPVAVFVVLVSGLDVAAGYAGRRHFYPLTPIVLCWAGIGLVAVAGALGRLRVLARWKGRLLLALGAALALSILPKSLGLLAGREESQDLWMRDVGLRLRSTIAASDGVLAVQRTLRAAFYSGGRVLGDGALRGIEDLERACARARELGARWVLVESLAAAPAPAAPPGFTLAGRFGGGLRTLLVYGEAR